MRIKCVFVRFNRAPLPRCKFASRCMFALSIPSGLFVIQTTSIGLWRPLLLGHAQLKELTRIQSVAELAHFTVGIRVSLRCHPATSRFASNSACSWAGRADLHQSHAPERLHSFQLLFFFNRKLKHFMHTACCSNVRSARHHVRKRRVGPPLCFSGLVSWPRVHGDKLTSDNNSM